LVPGISPG